MLGSRRQVWHVMQEWLTKTMAKNVEELEEKRVAGETEDCLSEKKLHGKILGEMKGVGT